MHQFLELDYYVYYGFMPKVDKCVNCEEENNIAYFSILNDGFKCTNCGKIDKSAITISPTTVDAIRYIISAPPKKIFSFDLSEESLREISLVSKVYLMEKIE